MKDPIFNLEKKQKLRSGISFSQGIIKTWLTLRQEWMKSMDDLEFTFTFCSCGGPALIKNNQLKCFKCGRGERV